MQLSGAGLVLKFDSRIFGTEKLKGKRKNNELKKRMK